MADATTAPATLPGVTLRDHESDLYELGHIVELIVMATDPGGELPPKRTNAVSFLAILAQERTDRILGVLDAPDQGDTP